MTRLRKTAGKVALAIPCLFVIAIFLQWIGMPNHWPSPAHTLYSDIANTFSG